MTDESEPSEKADQDFAELSQQSDPGLIKEFVEFLVHNKKWWLTPILVIMVLLTALAFLAASPVAPFIYTFF